MPFYACSSLKTLYFNKLVNIQTQLGSSASNKQFLFGVVYLEDVYFGGLKASTFGSAVNQFQYLCGTNTGALATNGCTIHFPSNFDPTNPDKTFDITTLTGYPTFGGNASYIHLAYDLPVTE